MAFKGLKEIQEKTAEIEGLTAQSRIRTMYLGNGESSYIRFIDDDEMLQTKIHEYEEITPTGKRFRKAYCLENLIGDPCKWCASGNYPKNVYVFLTYVYHTIHKNQNPELGSDPNAMKWEAVKQGGQVFYKEDVGGLRLLRLKWGKDFVNKNLILGFANAYGTLTDRDYIYSRTGEGIHTTYSFVPKDKAEMADEVKAVIAEAPHIIEVLTGKASNVFAADASGPKTKIIEPASSDEEKDVEDLF